MNVLLLCWRAFFSVCTVCTVVLFVLFVLFVILYYIKPQDRKEYKKFLDDMHTGDFTPVSWFIVCSHNDMHCAVNSVV